MKYIFYFSLLLFALSSCKSNSLMKQRYTHYSNKPAKKEITTPSNREQEERVGVTQKPDNSKQASESVIINEPSLNKVTEPPIYASNDAAPGLAGRKVAALPLNQTQTKSHEGFGVKKYSTQLKNSFRKKTESNRGPISALLRLVLSIILFVVLVTLIILLILLLV